MTLNSVSTLLTFASRLDHIRVNSALSKPLGIFYFSRLSLKYFDELFADNFALRFWISHACQLAHKSSGSIDTNDFYAEVAGKHLHHHVAFV